MDSRSGQLSSINVVGMEFVDNGRSFRLEIVESIPPHGTSIVTFENVVAVRLFQAGGDEYPLIVIDLTWRFVPSEQKERVLQSVEFPFMKEAGHVRIPPTTLVAVDFEGAIVGGILAEEITILAV